ncbi:cytidylate kinase [Hydromonas duriensis]|uniref:Cytidylate kinase n=2 Tax=Hydromonas duriensis TaxID=1527608 RepID=A0A4V3DJL4_9BURK|nr:cytidylate kinase [Hydromonas duriensis]
MCIDGPTASGKGAVAKLVSEALGFAYLDSGVLYRLVALQALRAGWADDRLLSENDELQLAQWAAELDVRFDGEQVLLNSENVALDIREERVGNMASKIAVSATLRSALLERQRAFAQGAGLVADGRDMGSVVFPDAPLKIFLQASAEVRAERRYKQLIAKGFSANMVDLLQDLNERDARDANRTQAPLKPAQDAYILDSSDLTLLETVDVVLKMYAQQVGNI